MSNFDWGNGGNGGKEMEVSFFPLNNTIINSDKIEKSTSST